MQPQLHQSQHPAENFARPHDERRREHPRLARLRDGRVRPVEKTARLSEADRYSGGGFGNNQSLVRVLYGRQLIVSEQAGTHQSREGAAEN